MRQTIASKTPRIEVVDALRGFAVMAILYIPTQPPNRDGSISSTKGYSV